MTLIEWGKLSADFGGVEGSLFRGCAWTGHKVEKVGKKGLENEGKL